MRTIIDYIKTYFGVRHTCRYCGCETFQPDKDCYTGPKYIEIVKTFKDITCNVCPFKIDKQ